MGNNDEIPEWDISPLVKSMNPEDVKTELDKALERSKKFQTKHKGFICEASIDEILQLCKDYDTLRIGMYNPFAYTYLSFSADSSDSDKTNLFEYGRKSYAEFESNLTFVKLELSKMLQTRGDVTRSPILAEFKHALEKMREEGKYHISDIEERLILQKDLFGIDSWSFLHETLRGTRRYEVDIDGEKKELGFLELFNLLRSDSNRDNRRKACRVLYEGMAKDRLVLSIALRSVFGDFINQMKLRKYPDIYAMTLLQNDIDRSVLDGLISAMHKNTDLIQRYLTIKAKIMKLPRLAGYDIDAPISMSESKLTWAEARKHIIDSFREFDEEGGDFVETLFAKKRIDASIRPGKTGFGYCQSVPSLRTSWIMVNFTGSYRDMEILTHEAGHALHDYFASKEHLWTNFLTGVCLSESASIFGELLLADKMLKEADDDASKISLLCKMMDQFRQMVFDMLHRFEFETNALSMMERNENLDADKLDSLWTSARTKIYGDSIEWPPEIKIWWAVPVQHYYPNFRFYNYPYAFGQLLVYALFGLYKEEGQSFVPKMKRILSAGASVAPKQLLAELGFDITDPKFWDIGFKQAEAFVDELETLVK